MPRVILIVDDNGVNREILKQILGSEYDILQAENGQAALAAMRREGARISAVLLDLAMPVMDGYQVLEKMRGDAALAQIPVIVTTGRTEEESEVKALSLGANDFITKPYNPEIIRHRVRNTINLRETAATVNALRRDMLTGLYNREAFLEKAAQMIHAREPGYYLIACINIDNFKVINDQYGTEKGDAVLRHVAAAIDCCVTTLGGVCCRVMADNFAVVYPRHYMNSPEIAANHREAGNPPGIRRPVGIRIGRYVIDDLSLPVSAMYDRAALAEVSIKGRYDVYIAQYDESMRQSLLHEQRIVTEMDAALREGQFEPWFQPQYNHATGALVGAEALVRWRHPKEGVLVAPGKFIPVFERNGFIYEMDKNIWEQVCVLLRKWIDEGRSPLPVSVNISRYDLFRDDFYGVITGLVKKYRIPLDLLHLEVTETAFASAPGQIVDIVRRLIGFGFAIELDDFGSGYSSLNTLKDVPATILKLDMKFIESSPYSQRGGNILESIVRMAKWLGMSVIAEGVETKEQANYLKSIGCYYVQGFLYARPMPASQYEALEANVQKERKMDVLETVEALNNNAFWDPKSMETLIFNSYVGGACILEYHNGQAEILRANDNYIRELGVESTARISLSVLDPEQYLDAANRRLLYESMNKAADSGEEAQCDVRMRGINGETGVAYIRVTLRLLARAGSRILFYATIINMTAQREAERKVRETAAQMRAIMDNAGSGITASFDQDGQERMLFANDKYYALLGYARSQYGAGIAGVLDTVYPDDRDKVRRALRENGGVGRSASIEYRAVRRDRSVVWVRAVISIARFDGIAQPVRLGVFTDVSAEKAAEQELHDTNRQLQTLMNDTPGGFCRIRLFPNWSGRLVYVNEGFEKLADMPREEIMALYGDDYMGVLHPDDRQAVVGSYRAAGEGNGQFHVKCRLRHGREGYIWVTVAGRLAGSDNGERFVNAYFTDVSAQSRIDEQRRELIENLPCGAGIYELSGQGMRATYLNKRYRSYVGRKLADLSTAPVMEVVHPEDRERLWDALQTALKQNHQGSCDIRIMDGHGGYIPFHVMGYIVEHIGEKTVIYVTYTPISKEEATLKETLPYILSAIMESTSDLSFAKDRDLRYLCCSRQFARMVGLKNEGQVVGKTDYDLFSREIAEKYRNDDQTLLESGKSIVDMVEVIPSEDGVVHYSSTSKHLLYDRAGDVVGLYGVGRDITEYRTAFERLKLLTNSIPGGLATYEVSREGMRALYFSDGYFLHTGYSREEYQKMAQDDPLCLVFPEDIPIIKAEVERVLDGSPSFNYEYRCHGKDGGYCWVNVQGVVVERHGDSAAVNVVKFDITQRKLAEEKLRMSEEQYRLAQAHSGNIVCRYDVCDRSVNMSGEAAALFQMTEKVTDVPYAPVRMGAVAPESVKDYVAFYEGILRGEESGTAEFQCRTAQGWRWWKGTFSTIFSNEKKPVYAVISLVDTTERHRQERERQALLEKERLLQEQAELDGLTGIFNRGTAEAMIRQALSRRDGKPCVLMIVDLDDLKGINDTVGHPQGDRALTMLARTLKAQFRQSDVVGRIGGDEFIVFLEGVGDAAKLREMTRSLIRNIASLRVGEDGGYAVCASVGVALCQGDPTTFDEMYQQADKALYYAKRNGKMQAAFYSSNIG